MADDGVEFRMPSLGSDMDEGTVLRWHVAVGDTVHKGDVLLDVDTDKSEIEVEVSAGDHTTNVYAEAWNGTGAQADFSSVFRSSRRMKSVLLTAARSSVSPSSEMRV